MLNYLGFIVSSATDLVKLVCVTGKYLKQWIILRKMNIQYQNLHGIFSKIDALNLKDIKLFFPPKFYHAQDWNRRTVYHKPLTYGSVFDWQWGPKLVSQRYALWLVWETHAAFSTNQIQTHFPIQSNEKFQPTVTCNHKRGKPRFPIESCLLNSSFHWFFLIFSFVLVTLGD